MDFREQFEALMPTDPLMQMAWVGSLRHAVSDPDMFAAFKAATGDTITPPRNCLETMIDEATGREEQFLLAFARWHNANVWGEDNGRPIDAPDTQPTETP